MKRVLVIAVMFVGLPLRAEPNFGRFEVMPTIGVVGTPTDVTIEADIAGPTATPTEMAAWRINSDGSKVKLGLLRDDGTTLYKLRTTLKNSSTIPVGIQVVAKFAGGTEISTPVIMVNFQFADAPLQSIAALAKALANGDRETALRYVSPSSKAYDLIKSGTKNKLDFLANSYRNAQLEQSLPDIRIFKSPVTRADGTVIKMEFEMVPGPGGQWVIN